MTQNEYDKWYRELNEAQKEATDEFFAWKEKASKGKDCYADIGITRINGKAEVALREGEYISPFRGFQMSLKQNGRILSSYNWRCEDRELINSCVAQITPLTNEEFRWVLDFQMSEVRARNAAAYTMDGFVEMARFSISFEEAKAFKASRNQGIRKNEWQDLTVVVGIWSKMQK